MCEYCSYADACIICGKERDEVELEWNINYISIDFTGEDDGYWKCVKCSEY